MKRVKPLKKGEYPTTLDEVISFERAHGIVLPESYRAAVVELGYGLDPRNLSSLDDWCQPREPEEMPEGFLKKAFPHQAAWNDTSPRTGGWDSPYFDESYWAGAMRIVNGGCELYYLLVVTGPERGTVWYDGRVDNLGIVPLVDRHGTHAGFETFMRGESYLEEPRVK